MAGKLTALKKVIIIASLSITALALLFYVITQSGRPSSGYAYTPDTYPHGRAAYFGHKAAVMAQYPAAIRSTVNRMVITGTNADDLDFTLPGEPGHKLPGKYSVFEPEGAGVPSSWFHIDRKAFDGEPHYVFSGANRIPSIETSTPEIIFITWPINKDVCNSINLGLRGNGIQLSQDWAENHILENPPDLTPFHGEKGNPVTDITVFEKNINNGYGYGGSGCAQDKNGIRYYIHTIVER